MHEAAWRAPRRVTELLLERGALIEALNAAVQDNLFHPDKEITLGHKTLLHLAAASGNIEAFELLRNAGAKLDSRDINGLFPIHIAAVGGSVPFIAALLDTGADPDARDAIDEETALYKAARKGFVKCVTLLLNRGADAKAKTRSGIDAREIALACSHEETVKVLSEGTAPSGLENSPFILLNPAP